ncbi:phage tail protein [Pseudomonas vancouverensis]|uniref:phage tail protein n=1 Tax=Pseudomonas vancouverensis TaxID=95300 RepID=UPI003CFF2268
MSNIDWSQLVTKAAKDEARAVMLLEAAKSAFTERNTHATVQISAIQDRIDTITYGLEAGEATAEDQAEQAALVINLKQWKAYKYELGKVPRQANWPATPQWPANPAIPELVLAPTV